MSTVPEGTTVLFDIDGTIIRAGDPAHRDAFEAAMLAVYGVPATLDGIRLGGRLDRQIARDALAAAQLDAITVETGMDHVMHHMGATYTAAVADGERASWLLPGVRDTAVALADAGAAVGVLTGGARVVARRKLEAAGVADLFPFGGYGCGADERHLLVAQALEEATALGFPVDAGSVVLVGDTPLDVDAARRAGAVAVAVATGRWSTDDLAATNPDVLACDLRGGDTRGRTITAAIVDCLRQRRAIGPG